MAIRYDAEEKNGYLHVTSSGGPESADEMFAYIQQIYAEVLSRGMDKFLVDESHTSIRFDFHSTAVGSPPVQTTQEDRERLRVAVVCASHSLEIYKHLKNMADATGLFDSQIFDNLNAAEEWLRTA